jgi:tRNA (cmo5U34)-methyltransferase
MEKGLKRAFDSGAQNYDSARRRLVPCFDDFYREAIELVPFERDAEFDVLDLGAGTGLFAALLAYSFPGARITLVDVSNEMLARARERLGPGGARFQFVERDYADGRGLGGPYDAVVSALSIHHLADDDKRALLGRVHEALKPGGVFVNADQVRGETDAMERRSHARWLERVRELGVSDRDLAQARERMKFDRPATVSAQLEWLREAGFREVACSYRNLIFAVYSGER